MQTERTKTICPVSIDPEAKRIAIPTHPIDNIYAKFDQNALTSVISIVFTRFFQVLTTETLKGLIKGNAYVKFQSLPVERLS